MIGLLFVIILVIVFAELLKRAFESCEAGIFSAASHTEDF